MLLNLSKQIINSHKSLDNLHQKINMWQQIYWISYLLNLFES